MENSTFNLPTCTHVLQVLWKRFLSARFWMMTFSQVPVTMKNTAPEMWPKGSMSPATSTFIKIHWFTNTEALEAKLQPHDGSLTHLLQAIKLEGFIFGLFFWGNLIGEIRPPPPPKWSKQFLGWWIIWWNWSDDVISKGILLGEFGLVSEKVTASNSVIHPELF